MIHQFLPDLALPDLVVILAAGVGRRLRPLTADRPKCLIPVAGIPFLQRTLLSLRSYPFRDICIVAGYLSDRVGDFLDRSGLREKAHLCRNPDFEKTNNAESLRVALQRHAGRPFLLLDGDLLFDEKILEGLLDDPREDLLVVETAREGLTGESMKVLTDPRDRAVMKIGKEVPLAEAGGEFIGMAKFSAKWSDILREEMESLKKGCDDYRDFYYEDLVSRLLCRSPAVGILPVNGLRWAEVDTPEEIKAVSSSWDR